MVLRRSALQKTSQRLGNRRGRSKEKDSWTVLSALLTLVATCLILYGCFEVWRVVFWEEGGGVGEVEESVADAMYEWYYEYFEGDDDAANSTMLDLDDRYQEGDEVEYVDDVPTDGLDPVAAAMERKEQERLWKAHLEELHRRMVDLQEKLESEKESHLHDVQDKADERAAAMKELEELRAKQAKAQQVQQRGGRIRGQSSGGGGLGGMGGNGMMGKKKKGKKKKKKKKKKKQAAFF